MSERPFGDSPSGCLLNAGATNRGKEITRHSEGASCPPSSERWTLSMKASKSSAIPRATMGGCLFANSRDTPCLIALPPSPTPTRSTRKILGEERDQRTSGDRGRDRPSEATLRTSSTASCKSSAAWSSKCIIRGAHSISTPTNAEAGREDRKSSSLSKDAESLTQVILGIPPQLNDLCRERYPRGTGLRSRDFLFAILSRVFPSSLAIISRAPSLISPSLLLSLSTARLTASGVSEGREEGRRSSIIAAPTNCGCLPVRSRFPHAAT
mmetsp:Transcript_33792/g.66914  ORF Transcript_33792/g.66914 Transcript_33792/m.66914 type:complete len:268 (-) Transcript_33792:948-1751(-)